MSSGMQNAHNFDPVVSSMVLEPSFFDHFFHVFPVCFFTSLVTAWAAAWGCRGTPRGLPGVFWGPRGPEKGFFWFLGAGGPGGASRLASLLALSWANRLL